MIILEVNPFPGKTLTAVKLAKKYQAALLTVDNVVQEAIAEGNTAAGREARTLCEDAGRKYAEDMRGAEGDDGADKKGGLSMEALTTHTQGAPGKQLKISWSVVCEYAY